VLAAAFGREQEEARERHETRPLWHLLVAIGDSLDQNPQGPDHGYLRNAMSDMESFVRTSPRIDPGGECKRRLGELQARIGA
jgi:hypothetical protein